MGGGNIYRLVEEKLAKKKHTPPIGTYFFVGLRGNNSHTLKQQKTNITQDEGCYYHLLHLWSHRQLG